MTNWVKMLGARPCVVNFFGNSNFLKRFLWLSYQSSLDHVLHSFADYLGGLLLLLAAEYLCLLIKMPPRSLQGTRAHRTCGCFRRSARRRFKLAQRLIYAVAYSESAHTCKKHIKSFIFISLVSVLSSHYLRFMPFLVLKSVTTNTHRWFFLVRSRLSKRCSIALINFKPLWLWSFTPKVHWANIIPTVPQSLVTAPPPFRQLHQVPFPSVVLLSWPHLLLMSRALSLS